MREIERQRHREMLVISLIAIVLSLVLRNSSSDRVTILGDGGFELPPLCQSRYWFDVECPGCGLTRSYVALAHGDWHSAWRFNRMGWIMFLATVVQVPYRWLSLKRAKTPLDLRWSKLFGNALIFGLIANWLVGLVWCDGNGGW